MKDPTQEGAASDNELDDEVDELSIKRHICYYPVYGCVVAYKKFGEPAAIAFDRYIDWLTIYPNVRWFMLFCMLTAHILRVYYLSKG